MAPIAETLCSGASTDWLAVSTYLTNCLIVMRIYKKCSRPRKEAVSRLYMRLQYRGERRTTLDNRSVLHDCLCYLSSTLMAATWFSSRRGLSREATRYSSPTSLKVYSTWMAGSLSYDVLYVAFDTFTNIPKQALTGAHGMRGVVMFTLNTEM